MSVLNANTLNCTSLTGALGSINLPNPVIVNDLTGFIVQGSGETHFDLSGSSTGTVTTFAFTSTANRDLTFPSGTDTIVTLNAVQTITNKQFSTGMAININPVEIGVGTFGLSALGSVAIGTNSTALHGTGVVVGPNTHSGSGIGNTCIGSTAGTSLSTGQYNTLLGFGAGDSITTGSNNVAIGGSNTLTNLTTGSRNIGIGKNTLSAITTNNDCVAIGNNALTLNTSSSMTAVGLNALAACTTGTNMTAIGYN